MGLCPFREREALQGITREGDAKALAERRPPVTLVLIVVTLEVTAFL